MASSRRNSPALPGIAACAAMLLGVGARAAAPACANAEIVVEAKPMEVDYRNNNAVLREVVITQCDMRIEAGEARVAGGLDFENSQWTISGNVRITAEGGHLKSDKAVVSFKDRLISQAVITGSPAQFEQTRDDGSVSRGRAGTIDYQITPGTVSFSDDAWLTDGKNQISGRTFVYNIRSQRVEGQSRASTPEKPGTDRIRIVIPARTPGEKNAGDKDQEKQP